MVATRLPKSHLKKGGAETRAKTPSDSQRLIPFFLRRF